MFRDVAEGVIDLLSCALQSSRLNQTMMEMSREMMKAGIIDEMMSDAIDGAVDSEDMEAETEEEVDRVRHMHRLLRGGLAAGTWILWCESKSIAAAPPVQCLSFGFNAPDCSRVLPLQVLVEIAGETMAQMAAAPKQRREQQAAVAAEEEEEDGLQDDLRARLEAVRS